MKTPHRPTTTEERELIRVEYETGGRTTGQMAADLGVAAVTLRKWAAKGGWKRCPAGVSATRSEAQARRWAATRDRLRGTGEAAAERALEQAARRLVPSVWALGTGERVTGRHGEMRVVRVPVVEPADG